MEVVAHTVESLPAVGQQGFGGLKGFAGSQGPGKSFVPQAHLGTDCAESVLFHHSVEVAAVRQHTAVDRTGSLGGSRVQHRPEGLVPWTAGTVPAAHRLYALVNGRPALLSLPGVTPVESKEIIGCGRQREGNTLQVGDAHRYRTGVDNPLLPGDDIRIGKNRVIKSQGDTRDFVETVHRQSFALPCRRKGHRQRGRLRLFVQNPPAAEDQLGYRCAGISGHRKSGATVVAPACHRKFPRQGIKVEVGVAVLGGIAALAGLGHAGAPPAAQSRAEITVQQVPAVQQLHHIADAAVGQVDGAPGFIKTDTHACSILWLKPNSQVSTKATAKATTLTRMYKGSCSLR